MASKVAGVLSAFILLLFASSVVSAADYYASPNGKSTGSGTQQAPWDLQTAFNKSTVIRPGDTLWLRGGTYGTGGATKFTTRLSGTKEQPIIIRQYKGERAIVDGGIETVSGSSFNWFWGFEITNSNPERKVTPSDRPSGINMLSPGHKAINMIIHDVGHPGIGFWTPVGDGGEIYGTILWGNGLYDTTTIPGTADAPWTRGSPIYAQNQVGNRFIEDTITFRNFTTGMKAYTEGGWANGFVFRGNTTFDSGDRILFVSARDNPVQSVLFEENYTYRPKTDSRYNVHLGYANVDQVKAEVKNNYFVGGASDVMYFERWRDATVTGNTIVGTNSLVNWFKPLYYPFTASWSDNSYFGGSAKPFRIDNTTVDFNTWKSSGFDYNSIFTTAFPTQNKIFVRPNKYQAGRANITIYNWEQKDNVDVDLSSVLQTGDNYEIRDVQNYFKVIKSGTYNGAVVSLPTTLTEVEPLVGDVTHLQNIHTSKEFNVFVVAVPARETETPNQTPQPSASPTPKAGDANADNKVDGIDYVIWLNHYGQNISGVSNGDFNDDSKVDGIDYVIWLNNYGK